jgi:23S rRNA pseudouridine1911/1915/1917 synthase
MKRTFTYTITSQEAGTEVGNYLRSLGYSRHILVYLKKTENGILVNGEWAYVRTVLREGDILSVYLAPEESSPNIVPVSMPLSIVYEDEDILVINKPADTPIHPSQNNYDNTLANGIAFYYQQKGDTFVYRCINRLDRDTTGLLIIAKHMLSAAILSQMMLDRQIHRTYRAVAAGIAPKEGTIDAPIGRAEGSAIERTVDFLSGERAVTHYRRVYTETSADGESYSLMELCLDTGRTHQIRVHMKYLGYPLLGDYLYHPDYRVIKRQALHSYRLEFTHPITRQPLSFTEDIPDDMKAIFRKV